MSTQADKLNAKLEELADRAAEGVGAMDAMVAHANAKARDINHRARTELEKAGRSMREASDRRMRARE